MDQRLLNFGGLLIDPAEQQLDLERYDLEEHLYPFTKQAWAQIDPAPFRTGWPIEAVCEHLEAVVDGEIKRLIINIPPRSGKSTLCSVCFPSWVWAQPAERNSATSGPGVQFGHRAFGQRGGTALAGQLGRPPRGVPALPAPAGPA